MKFIAYFFLKKLQPRGTQEQNLGAYSRDFRTPRLLLRRQNRTRTLLAQMFSSLRQILAL